MKFITSSLLSFFVVLSVVSCASNISTQPKNNNNPKKADDFKFTAEYATIEFEKPYVINQTLSLIHEEVIPPRKINLDDGYAIELADNELVITLPIYYGYNTNHISNNYSEKFISKDFTVNTKVNKKGITLYTIKVKDQKKIENIRMEVYKGGKAYVQVEDEKGKASSYSGFLKKNDLAKN